MNGEGVHFGQTRLPDRQAEVLRRAVRLEWVTIGFLVITATLVFLVLGNSQAMKAAWAEDLLSFIPPSPSSSPCGSRVAVPRGATRTASTARWPSDTSSRLSRSPGWARSSSSTPAWA